MEQAVTIGLDLAKHVFQAHGADVAGHVLFRRRLTRARLLGFLAAQAPCVVAMEACAVSHYWGREVGKLGHVRGHLSEYGYVFRQSITHAAILIAHVDDRNSSLPESARVVLRRLIDTFTALEAQMKELDGEINRRSRADPVARRLMTILGVGPITATAITALVPAAGSFRTGRDFAAWLGLTPLQKSTGGKQKLGAISKRGERTIRRLLILGASAVIRQACRRAAPAGSWLAQMLLRKPKMLVTVALANKMARVVWALLVKGGVYRAPATAVS